QFDSWLSQEIVVVFCLSKFLKNKQNNEILHFYDPIFFFFLLLGLADYGFRETRNLTYYFKSCII
ncbi:hypothetical protein, partial [Mycoplasma sp. 1232]|uniref:hypothetical protein n=1 Tax=Mycoplasma sp. 1232 TaxID=3108527 RepID=UPI002B25A8A3